MMVQLTRAGGSGDVVSVRRALHTCLTAKGLYAHPYAQNIFPPPQSVFWAAFDCTATAAAGPWARHVHLASHGLRQPPGGTP